MRRSLMLPPTLWLRLLPRPVPPVAARLRQRRRRSPRWVATCRAQVCWQGVPQGGLGDDPITRTLAFFPPVQAAAAGGGQAKAFAAALAKAVATGGCGSVSNVLARESPLPAAHDGASARDAWAVAVFTSV